MMTPTVDCMVSAGLCFGDHDGTCRTQTRHRCCIAGRPPASAFLLFSFADETCGVDPVLYRDRPSRENTGG